MNYTSRMAEDAGLARIGMLDNGIIWNNQTEEWRKLRQYFQRSVNSHTLNMATKVTMDSAEFASELFPSFHQADIGANFDLLEFLRTVTLVATNKLMFGVDMNNHAELIEAIGACFKAWEFFLIWHIAVQYVFVIWVVKYSTGWKPPIGGCKSFWKVLRTGMTN